MAGCEQAEQHAADREIRQLLAVDLDHGDVADEIIAGIGATGVHDRQDVVAERVEPGCELDLVATADLERRNAHADAPPPSLLDR